jgi:hypothetical protein
MAFFATLKRPPLFQAKSFSFAATAETHLLAQEEEGARA